jgi:hypothetical protein
MLGLLVLAVLLTGAAEAFVQGALPSGSTVTFMGGGVWCLSR